MFLNPGRDFDCPNCGAPQSNLALRATFKGGTRRAALQPFHGCMVCGERLRLRAKHAGALLVLVQLVPGVALLVIAGAIGFGAAFAYFLLMVLAGLFAGRQINHAFYYVEVHQ